MQYAHPSESDLRRQSEDELENLMMIDSLTSIKSQDPAPLFLFSSV